MPELPPKRFIPDPADEGDESFDPPDRVGFPAFEHNQWTFEGEIERIGAMARSLRSDHVPASTRIAVRSVSWLLLLALGLPLVGVLLFVLFG